MSEELLVQHPKTRACGIDQYLYYHTKKQGVLPPPHITMQDSYPSRSVCFWLCNFHLNDLDSHKWWWYIRLPQFYKWKHHFFHLRRPSLHQQYWQEHKNCQPSYAPSKLANWYVSSHHTPVSVPLFFHCDWGFFNPRMLFATIHISPIASWVHRVVSLLKWISIESFELKRSFPILPVEKT